MDKGRDRDRDRDRGDRRGGGRRGFRRGKVCRFCVSKIEHLDYKDTDLMRSFVSERGKIIPRRVTGTCAKHQRKLRLAIHRARNIALLPFVAD